MTRTCQCDCCVFLIQFGPALRIADKIFKFLQINELQATRVSLVYHSFPFSAVYYHALPFFLATYWPLRKLGLQAFRLELLRGEVLLVEQRRVELLASALRTRRSAN